MEIVFANTAEAFLGVLRASAHQPGAIDRMDHETALSHRALFWLSDQKLVLTPTAIPEDVLEQCYRVTGWRNVTNWALPQPRLDLCGAIVDDTDLFSRLVGFITRQTHTRLSAYAVTPAYAQLALLLEQAGCQFTTLECLSRGSVDLQAHLDSKVGFRNEMARIEGEAVLVPEGYVCSNLQSAIDATHYFLSRSKGCVVKSNLGESGWGTLIIHRGHSVVTAAADLANSVAGDAIWNYFPLVVEEYIEITAGSKTAFPSVEVIVTNHGPELTYCCAQIIRDFAAFMGISLGQGILPDLIQDEVLRIARTIGKHYYSIGYRGYFDIDFIVREDDRIFALETNARRTGGTHAYDLMLALGLANTDWLCHSEDSIKFAKPISDATEAILRIKPLLYEPAQNKPGIVPTIVDARSNNFGFVAIGRRGEDVTELVNSVRGLM